MTLQRYLQQTLAVNQLDVAIRTALLHLENDEFRHGQVIHFSSRLTEWETRTRQDVVSNEQLRQEKNRLLADFIAFVSDLPNEIIFQPEWSADRDDKTISSGVRGISEARFKWSVFVGLVTVKGGFLVFLYYSQSVGTFNSVQYHALKGSMLPTFAATFAMMIKHIIDRRHQMDNAPGPRINWQVQWITYVVLLAYLLSLLLALHNFGTRSADFKSLINWVSSTEALLGAALGYVISTLFKQVE